MHFTFNYNLLSVSTTTTRGKAWWNRFLIWRGLGFNHNLSHQKILIVKAVIFQYYNRHAIAIFLLNEEYCETWRHSPTNPEAVFNAAIQSKLFHCFNLFFATCCLFDLKQSFSSNWINTTCAFCAIEFASVFLKKTDWRQISLIRFLSATVLSLSLLSCSWSKRDYIARDKIETRKVHLVIT